MTDALRQRIAHAMAETADSMCFRQPGREWEHMRSVWRGHADAVLAVLKPELDELLQYRNAICWETSCLTCSANLDASYGQHTELEQERDEALAALERVRAELRALRGDVRGKTPVALAGLREAAARIDAILPKETQ